MIKWFFSHIFIGLIIGYFFGVVGLLLNYNIMNECIYFGIGLGICESVMSHMYNRWCPAIIISDIIDNSMLKMI